MYANTRSKTGVMASMAMMYITLLIVTTVAISVLVLQTSQTIGQARASMLEVAEGFATVRVAQVLPLAKSSEMIRLEREAEEGASRPSRPIFAYAVQTNRGH